MKAFTLQLAILLCPVLTNCAPKGIPPDARLNVDFSIDGGASWEWKRSVHSGCVSWTAKKEYAIVFIDTQTCDAKAELNIDGIKGISYFSVEDFLVFTGYWPWNDDIYSSRWIFDSQGDISKILDCPNTISASQLDELKSISQETLGLSTTFAEKRILARIIERLSEVDGNALTSGQAGCTDLPENWYIGRRPKLDYWQEP